MQYTSVCNPLARCKMVPSHIVSGFGGMGDRFDSILPPNFLDINSFLTDHA
jgi:hypothetical protein